MDDRVTQKIINHPGVKRLLPTISQTAKKVTKRVKSCQKCPQKRRPAVRTVTDLNAVRECIANLPPAEKAKLKKVLNTKELVVPYVRRQDKRRVKLKF
jgi:hypothetical protein